MKAPYEYWIDKLTHEMEKFENCAIRENPNVMDEGDAIKIAQDLNLSLYRDELGCFVFTRTKHYRATLVREGEVLHVQQHKEMQ